MEVQLPVVKVSGPPAVSHKDATPNWAEEAAQDKRTKSDRIESIAGSVENAGEAEMNKGLDDIPESEAPLPSDSNPHPREAGPVDNADRPMVELEEVVLLIRLTS
ncbi:hypothetical protein DXG01_004318 [Tephrocybe rancida]|nr:hypothetical protein DXG01_004318 [Tephrocybe rancida]